MTTVGWTTDGPDDEAGSLGSLGPSGPSGSSGSSGPSLAERAAADGVEFVLAMFTDLSGKPCAKLVPISAVDLLEGDGVGFAGYAVGRIGQVPSDPDLVARPDPRSYAALPWVRPGLAVVQCDLHVTGAAWPYSPRQILRRTLARASRRGYDAKAGAELEYFLVRRDADGAVHPFDSDDRADKPCYDARSLTRMYDHLAEVSTAMTTLGWGNYANDHEDGNGQFEQNFAYADALTTADRIITARYLISMLAQRRGMIATFMPKPFTHRTGTGMHLHLSLWRDGIELFPAPEDERGLGLSVTAYGFVAGLMSHAAGLQALLAPTVNSYKRTGAASTSTSGATWSPRIVSYGGNDRTHYIRVPDGRRIELRACDGSANPYLALAGVVAAGLDGIENAADPGEPSAVDCSGKQAAELPLTLLHACEALAADDVLRAAFGDDVIDYFVATGREQFLAWHAVVSAWEIDQYLTAF